MKNLLLLFLLSMASISISKAQSPSTNNPPATSQAPPTVQETEGEESDEEDNETEPQDDNASNQELEEIKNKISQLNNEIGKLTEKSVQFGLSIGYRFLTANSLDEYQQFSISPIDSTLKITQLDGNDFILSTSVLFNPKLKTETISKAISTQIKSYLIDSSNQAVKDFSAIDQSLLFEIDQTLTPESTLDEIQKSKLSLDDNTNIDPILVYSFLGELKDQIKQLDKTNPKYKQEKKQKKRVKNRVRNLFLMKFVVDYFFDRISINANLNLIEFSTAQQELSFNQSIEGGLGLSYQINPHLYIGVNWDTFLSRQLHPHLKDFVGQKLIINGAPLTSSSQLDINNPDLFYDAKINGLSLKVIATF